MCDELSNSFQPLSIDPDEPEQPPSAEPFPVVGIGASAGGLEACTELLKNLPQDTGMAFVVVQHLAPNHSSMLTELLSRNTNMPVQEATEGVGVRPNHVYVIPPNRDMNISGGILHLVPRSPGRAPHLAIDHFLTSLAVDQKFRGIGIILSGSSSDGTLGMKAIKAEGGITFAQDKSSSRFSAMPNSAVDAGYVDFVLPPAGIASELARLGRHPYLAPAPLVDSEPVLPDEGRDLSEIFVRLRTATGVDF